MCLGCIILSVFLVHVLLEETSSEDDMDTIWGQLHCKTSVSVKPVIAGSICA